VSIAKLEPAFSVGEVSPALYGRYDLARISVAATTMRNMFVAFDGGAFSRAGTKFVGFSKQTGRSYPPRLIPFQFNINQGLALEFGHFYMRVISNGAFVTESPLSISGITQANPAVVSSGGSGATAASPITSGVMSTYAPGDTVTLTGGTYLSPAILSVTNTRLVSLLLNSAGTGVYAPADTINLSGGTMTTTAVVTVATTQVTGIPTVAAAGTGGTPGTATVTGTTGTGTKFEASVTISAGGMISSVDSLTVAGDYTVNPTTPTAEPVTGGGLSGAQLDIKLGVKTFTISNAGVFTTNAPSGNFTQASTSGSGTGATFQQGIFGPNACTISTPGVYSAVPSNPVSQGSSSGSGLGATFTMTWASVAAFSADDWVYISGVNGMTEVNGETYVIKNPTPTTFELYDVYGNPVDSTTFGMYTSGGTVARIYTVSAPYAESDLPYLKFTQSKDVMSLCLVNQTTLTEYPTYDLSRIGNTDWEFNVVSPSSSVEPPTSVSGSASSSGSTYYQYVVTSIDPDDGTESVASDPASISSAVDISATAGAITISWTPSPGVNQQNVYKATPAYGASPPIGSQFGFAGIAFGAQFIDSNIVADFSQVPPQKKNPFARGAILGATPSTVGTGYSSATITINTSTGSGAEFEAIINNGGVVGYRLVNGDGGSGYASTDTITVTGSGTGATAVLNVGPQTGTYPGCVSYIQGRRVYGYTLNNPDTYYMSQPDAFTNFDSRIPTIATDAIVGSPWSVAVNGIQAMVPMPGGLIVLTGDDAWQLTGTGGSSFNPQPIAPDTQQAQPQAANGCSDKIPPIKIDYDIIYVQSLGSIYRNYSYEYINNIYTGADMTLNSAHLFTGHTIKEHAWCEQPYKMIWAVRDDGILLSLTYVKPQQVAGWARHDTNGLFQSVCSIKEPPVSALYTAVQRYPNGNTAYMIERMDDRIWSGLDDAWCVDAGLELPQPTPAATLRVSSATGLGAISGYSNLVGGSGYSASTTATVVDDNGAGPGTGAAISLTIVGGVITALTIDSPGTLYTYPSLVISDPAGSGGGSGASANLILDNSATFTASAGVFSSGNVGDVIRVGGGIAEITAYTSPTVVTANIIRPITSVRPNSGGQVNPQAEGSWTLTTPVSSIGGLKYLAGATVTGVADGVVIPPTVVPASGIIDLPQPSTNVVVGLGFGAQLQSVYLDGESFPTIQGQRKKISAITARVTASADFEIGANEPDGAAQSPIQIAPEWVGMVPAQTSGRPPYGSDVKPLWTGDIRIPVSGGFDVRGQAAVQQMEPFPLSILAFIPEAWQGDPPQK